jgi:hypothetical protein
MNANTSAPGSRRALPAVLAALALFATAIFLLISAGEEPAAMTRAGRPTASHHAGAGRRVGDDGATPLISTMSWAAPSTGAPSCGRWPTAETEEYLTKIGVDTDGLGWQCAESKIKDKWSTTELVTPAACQAWCEASHDPSSATTGRWCCQWTPSRGGGGGECVWSNGLALYTNTRCVPGARHEACAKPLAYEACSLASAFVAMPQDAGCRHGGRGSLGLVAAKNANECSRMCEASKEGCTAFAFSAKESMCARPSCELYSQCRSVSTKGKKDDFVYYNQRADAALRSALAPEQTPGWPQELGRPLGEVVDPKLVPKEQDMLSALSSLGASNFDPEVEYECDGTDGKKATDAMNLGGDWPNSCSQICLPKAFWGPAAKRGVVHGHCKDNGCSTFVATRKYVGVVYSSYNCAFLRLPVPAPACSVRCDVMRSLPCEVFHSRHLPLPQSADFPPALSARCRHVSDDQRFSHLLLPGAGGAICGHRW